MHCPVCDGRGTPLGRLGWLRWWRCRHCGLDFSTRDKPYVKCPLCGSLVSREEIEEHGYCEVCRISMPERFPI
jgi:rubrerythrin